MEQSSLLAGWLRQISWDTSANGSSTKATEADVCSIVKRKELARYLRLFDERLEKKGQNLLQFIALRTGKLSFIPFGPLES